MVQSAADWNLNRGQIRADIIMYYLAFRASHCAL